MSDAEKMSLFSLEVVVDEVSVPGITCRYPAVAVRLMDFPTLMIHHADDRMRRLVQVNLLHKASVPPQFFELLDSNENFAFKKGKSCLFKFDAKALRSHLATTPMYVLLVDTYPETPKLIASCVIPLTESMNHLYDHITTVGVAVPETDGKRAIYPLRNLMGVDVGHIIFGYRMLSLGEGLLQHIPAESLVTRESENIPDGTKDDKAEIAHSKSDVVQPTAASKEPVKAKKPSQNKLRRSKPEVLEMSTVQHIFNESLLDREYFAAATQTEAPRRDVAVGGFEEDDVNVYHPPPLYYNATADEKPNKPVAKFGGNVATVGFEYDEYDESVEEEEREVIIPGPVVYHSPRQFQPSSGQGMQYADVQQSLSQFPVLRALFDELNRIQGGAGFQFPASATVDSKRPKPSSNQKSNPKVKVETPTRGKENRSDFIQRISAPKNTVHWERPPLPKSNEASVPKHKSWIRKERLVCHKKSKLAYGMTNTQRLRLAMNNPQKLQELESDQTNSPMAQKLLQNLAGFGQTQVLNNPIKSDEQGSKEEVRPVPTPRRYPPVRHSNELIQTKPAGHESENDNDSKKSDNYTQAEVSRSVHIPVASYNEKEVIEQRPPKFPGFKPDDINSDTDDIPVRDSGLKIPMINPKASKSSPVASLRNSQVFASALGDQDERVGETVGPMAKPRPSAEHQVRPVLKAMKSVSFDASELDDHRTDSSEISDRKPYKSPATAGRSGTVRTDSVSSYTPSDFDDAAAHEYSQGDDGEYSDDFEVDNPLSPSEKPSNVSNVYSMAHLGFT